MSQTLESLLWHLPVELKMNIFDNIMAKKRQKLRRISKTWDMMISDIYEVTIVFENNFWKISSCCSADSIHGIFRNLTSNIFEIYYPPQISETCTSTLINLPDTPLINELSIANRLTSLTFQGIIELFNVVPLLLICSNVRNIVFDKVSCSVPTSLEINSNLDDFTKLLPALKNVKIIYNNKSANMISILQKFTMFFGCGTSLSKLRTVELQNESYFLSVKRHDYIPLTNIFNEDWSTSYTSTNTNTGIVELCTKLVGWNRKTLSEFKVTCKAYHYQSSVKFYPVKENKTRFQNAIVEKFYLKTVGTYPVDYGNWLTFLSSQIYIQKFCFFSELLHSPIEIMSIINNNSYLKYLSFINFYDREFTLTSQATPIKILKLNGSSFTHLQNLQELSILKNNSFRLQIDILRHGLLYELFNINQLPTMIRVLKLSCTIVLNKANDFTANTFKNLINLEVFEFSASPWFQLGHTMITYMDADKIIGLMNWLPKLKCLKLRNRSNPYYKIPMSPKIIPDCSIGLIKFLPGVNIRKIRVKNDRCRFFKNSRYDHFIEISIQPEYRGWKYHIL